MTDILPISPEQADLRDAVRQVAGKYGHKYFVDCATSHKEPTELYEELGAAGFLGVHLPEEYGGGGAGLAELCVVIEEVSAAGCPLLMMVIAPAICGSIIAAHGSPELKQAWLPGLANGTRTMSFAITEPDAGSNTHALTTTARRDGDDYVISGTKYWISGPDQADAILVVTRDGDPPAGRDTPMSMFVVPAGSAGLTMHAIEAELIQPEKQFTVFFDRVRVPAGALVGEAGQGFRAVFSGLNPERVTAAAISNGISRYALERATRYAQERSVWKTPIGAHQGVAHPLAECHIAVTQARLLTARAAELADAGDRSGEAVNMAKFAAAEASLKTLDQAIQVHGGNGLSREYGLADLWFLARMLRTAPTSREMVLNFVAQHSLGLPASY
ncbi:MAG TPA: acyl-CoA dehydrogenase family protein [Streptosporangiaceae bacterium]|jgi:alkylation response protein AidB-like acyl-CoA dehydrogenase|nr:acyl-CoA dehydrogenase family protein [Streptosporangiaceae bacterium]